MAPSPDDMAGLSQELAAKVKNSEALMAIANNGFLKPALDGCTLPADRMKLQAEHIFQKRQEDLGKELEQCRISFPKLYRMAKQPDALTLHFMDMGREFWLSLTLGRGGVHHASAACVHLWVMRATRPLCSLHRRSLHSQPYGTEGRGQLQV